MFAGLLCAQTPPPAAPPAAAAPPTAFAAPPRQPVPADTVVAEVGDKKVTAAEMDKLLADYPAQVQMAVRSNPGRNLTQILLFKHLKEMAEQEGLDQKAPYKQTLEYQRTALLAQAEMNAARYRTEVTQEEVEKTYKEHPERFRQARVRAIYVAFNPLADRQAGDKKPSTEAEAKTKIEDLRKQILAGADFGKLARENSDDKTSAAKDGDFGIVKKSSPYPDALKNAILALKAGDVSEPLRQPTGYYLIRVDEFAAQPYSEVSGQILEEIRQANFDGWMKSMESRFAVKIENPTYFAPGPQGPLQPPR